MNVMALHTVVVLNVQNLSGHVKLFCLSPLVFYNVVNSVNYVYNLQHEFRITCLDVCVTQSYGPK